MLVVKLHYLIKMEIFQNIMIKQYKHALLIVVLVIMEHPMVIVDSNLKQIHHKIIRKQEYIMMQKKNKN